MDGPCTLIVNRVIYLSNLFLSTKSLNKFFRNNQNNLTSHLTTATGRVESIEQIKRAISNHYQEANMLIR